MICMAMFLILVCTLESSFEEWKHVIDGTDDVA